MKTLNLDELKSENPDFLVRGITKNNFFELKQLVLQPMEVIDKALHVTKTGFIFVQGKAIVEVDFKRHVVNTNTYIEIEPNTEIGIINGGETELVIIFIKYIA